MKICALINELVGSDFEMFNEKMSKDHCDAFEPFRDVVVNGCISYDRSVQNGCKHIEVYNSFWHKFTGLVIVKFSTISKRKPLYQVVLVQDFNSQVFNFGMYLEKDLQKFIDLFEIGAFDVMCFRDFYYPSYYRPTVHEDPLPF